MAEKLKRHVVALRTYSDPPYVALTVPASLKQTEEEFARLDKPDENGASLSLEIRRIATATQD